MSDPTQSGFNFPPIPKSFDDEQGRFFLELRALMERLHNEDQYINGDFFVGGGAIVEGNLTVEGSLTVEGTPKLGFVNRGDPAVIDLQEGNGDTDFSSVGDIENDWFEFDLNSIADVPTTAKAVLIELSIVDDAINSQVQLRDSANSSVANISIITTQVANQTIKSDKTTPLTNGIIDIRTKTVKFSDITVLTLTVKGWWL